MNVRFYVDPATGLSHLESHGVTESEVEQAIESAIEDRPAERGTRALIGRTHAGRVLRVIFVPDPEPDSVFVLTAYDLGPKALRALRRRMRRRS